MPTIDDVSLVNDLIQNLGYYKNDTRVVKIVKYTNAWKGISYGLIYAGMHLGTYNSNPPYINNPETLFEVK